MMNDDYNNNDFISMQEFVKFNIEKLKKYYKNQSNKSFIIDRSWILLVPDNKLVIYTFKKDGELLISIEGNVHISKYELINKNQAVIIKDKENLNQYDIIFLQENLFFLSKVSSVTDEILQFIEYQKFKGKSPIYISSYIRKILEIKIRGVDSPKNKKNVYKPLHNNPPKVDKSLHHNQQKKDNTKGIGGWLIVVGIAIFVTLMNVLNELFVNFSDPHVKSLFQNLNFQDFTSYDYFLFYNNLFSLLYLFLLLYLFYLFLSKSELFPSTFIVLTIIELISIYLYYYFLIKLLPGYDSLSEEDMLFIFYRHLNAIILILYMLLSKRVRTTFINHL